MIGTLVCMYIYIYTYVYMCYIHIPEFAREYPICSNRPSFFSSSWKNSTFHVAANQFVSSFLGRNFPCSFRRTQIFFSFKHPHLFVLLEIETLDHLETPLVQLHWTHLEDHPRTSTLFITMVSNSPKDRAVLPNGRTSWHINGCDPITTEPSPGMILHSRTLYLPQLLPSHEVCFFHPVVACILQDSPNVRVVVSELSWQTTSSEIELLVA